MGIKDNPDNTRILIRASHPEKMRDPMGASWNQVTNNATSPVQPDITALIDFGQMDAIFANFLEVTGLPMAIIDLNGKVLASSKWQHICMEYHRQNPETLTRCLQSDINLSKEMQSGKDIAIYRCNNGLTDCAAPIVVDGQHIANLFIGQFLLEEPDLAFFKRQQEQFGFDEAGYFKALEEVPIISEAKLPAILKLISGLACHVADLSLARMKALQSQTEIERKVDERTRQLSASEARLAEAQHVAHIGSWEMDIVHNRLTWSEEMYRIFGLEHDEFGGIYEAFLNTLHPDDRDLVDRAYTSSLEPGGCYDIEYRIIRKSDGQLCWGHAHCEHERDANGKALRSYGTVQDITEYKQMEDKLQQQALYDALTKLPNRRLLGDRLSQAMVVSNRSGRYGALLFLDLDSFKSLNDLHGHAVGDLLLIDVADRLISCVREVDTVARFGGDEFLVLIRELDTDKGKSISQAEIIAKKISNALSVPYLLTINHDGEPDTTVEHHCTASIGVALFIHQEASQDDIIKWADMAMYRAKKSAPNSILFYDSKDWVTA